MAPDELDKALPEWWASWEGWEKTHGRPWAAMPATFPDPDEHPELHRLAFPEFGYRDAGRAFEPGNPWNRLESHLHLTRKPGATALDFEGDDPGIVTATALGWGSASAMRAFRMTHAYATRDPERQHYQSAEAVIRVREDREATEKERRALAEAICEAVRELAKRLEWDADGLLKLPWWDAKSSVRALGGTRGKPTPRDPARDARLVAAGLHVPKPVSAEEHERYEQHMARWEHGRVVNAKTLNLAGSLGKVADLLEGLGSEGKAWAESIRESPEDTAWWAQASGPNDCPDGPTRSPLIWALTEALWLDKVKRRVLEETKREQELALRRKRIPAPTMPLIFARTFGRLADPELKPVVAPGGALTRFETDGPGRVRLHVPAAALLAVSGALTVPNELRRVLVPLVACLTRAVHERWINGEERFDYIPVRTGRDELRTLLGVETTAVDVLAALHFLQDFTVAGIPCVSSIIEPKDDSPRNGRPREGLVVQLGAPLAPYGLERVFDEAGLALPPDLRWYGPTFDPSAAPVQGQKKTFWTQRNAYALGLGVALVELRKPYAENGGVTLKQLLEALGDTIRAPTTTVESLLKTWRQLPPYQDSMSWNGPEAEPPVLVEVTRGSGIYRLSPQRHEGAHQLIVSAGAHSKEKAARMAKAAAIKKRAQRGKPPAKP